MEHVYVKFGDYICIVFEMPCQKTDFQMHKYIYATENPIYGHDLCDINASVCGIVIFSHCWLNLIDG